MCMRKTYVEADIDARAAVAVAVRVEAVVVIAEAVKRVETVASSSVS